eukprot:365596-Chlamydomonas_euryale.AAC.17
MQHALCMQHYDMCAVYLVCPVVHADCPAAPPERTAACCMAEQAYMQRCLNAHLHAALQYMPTSSAHISA